MGDRRVVAVLSGKGGVGKTTVAVGLAMALQHQGHQVGVLDADLYGPDVPRLLGLTRTRDARSLTLWSGRESRPPEPIERYGLKVWSAQFLISERQALTVEAPLARLLMERAFGTVGWGDIDWLVVDLPPGTADLQQRLGPLGVGAAVLVVTPQDVAHLDAKKVLTMLSEGAVPVLGGVENMAPMTCGHCGSEVQLFPGAPYERTIWAAGVDRLARLPFSTVVTSRAEVGSPLLDRQGPGDLEGAFGLLASAVAAAYPSP
ncbi:MAG TPA: P-loop NTPase [Acidimicrobiales bacterium]|nr:P-loop NTPase [Acidimicrobiales bacterium]